MDVPFWAWAATAAVIVGMLLLDLLVFHRNAQAWRQRAAPTGVHG